MIGWLGVLISAGAAVLLIGSGHPVLLVIAILNTLACFWSLGVMHNFATSGASDKISRLEQNLEAEGRLTEERQEAIDRLTVQKKPEAIPDWIATVNMVTWAVGILLLLYALFAV